MTKQFDTTNIKSILFYDENLHELNHDYSDDIDIVDDEYVVALTRIDLFELRDDSFVIKGNGYTYEIVTNDVYIIKHDNNVVDEFDNVHNVHVLKSIDARFQDINDDTHVIDTMNVDDIDYMYTDDIDSYNLGYDYEFIFQRICIVDENDNEYVMINNNDCLLNE